MFNFRNNWLFRSIIFCCVFTLIITPTPASAQVIWSSITGTAWMTGSNWIGGSLPASGQIAQFNANPTSPYNGIGINMDTASGAVSIGSIYVSSGRTANLLIGNSSPTTPGTLSLTGTTITVPNVAIANFASGYSRLTLQNTQGSGASTLALNFSGSFNKILTGIGTPTSIGNTIIINTIIGGSGLIDFQGGGTWDGYADTGSNGGLLKLGAENTIANGISAGNADGSSSGIIELDDTSAINNTTGNNITINPNSQLYLASTSGATYTASNAALYLNGLGNNYTTTGKGALVNLTGNSYTWDGEITLATDAAISVLGAATTSITLPRNIGGTGQLIKTGPGNLVLGGTGNSWIGGTQINGGKITVNSGSALCNGPLLIAQVSPNPSLVLNNSNQSITSLTSTFTTTGNTNTITLNGTRLVINQSTNTEYGGPSGAQNSIINGSGSVIKSGTGTLKLTSVNNNFTGGLTIDAGKIKLNPSNGISITITSPDTLNGGTLSTDSINRTFTYNLGTLALTDNSTIELGSDTAHYLKFSASNAITWVSGKTLTVTHWAGGYNSTSGTRGRIYIGSATTGLTASQLAQIKFDDGAGHIYNATILSSGEVVPVAPVITTTTASYGPFCNNTSSTLNVAFTSTGPFSGSYKVQLSNASGVFPTDFITSIIGTGSTSPISVTIAPGATAGTGYRVRVINPAPTPTFGNNNGSNITITGAPVVGAISGPNAIANGGTGSYTNTTGGGSWTSSTPSVASVNATGVVTALSIGIDTISYTVTNSCGISATVTKTIAVVAIPSVTSISPLQGIPGTTVTITGTNFNTTATNNVVYFGASRATVSAGSATSLTVTVPVNASYGLVSVTDTLSGLSAFSKSAFMPTYTNTGLIPNIVNFKPIVNYAADSSPVAVVVSDLDGDGRADVVVSNSGPNTIYIYRNVSSVSGISSATFGSHITLTTLAGPHYIKIADIDGDGKPDIIVANTSTSANKISIFRNTSTTGGISFATRVDYSIGGSSPIDLCIADFDMDGKPDIAVVDQGSSKVAILRNLSSPGIITGSSFASAVLFTTGLTPFKIFAGDLDGDGITDIAVTNYTSNSVSLFHNNGTIGSISASTFSSPTTLSGVTHPVGIAGGDIDGDGKTDILVTRGGAASLSVYRNTNTTSGTFSFGSNVDFAVDSTAEDLAIGDIDGDGKLDVAIGNYYSNSISILRNTASSGSITTSSFAAHTDIAVSNSPAGIAISDIDGDGKPDLAVVIGGGTSVSFLKNYPLPPVGAITGRDSICIGTTTTLTNSVSGGTWISTNPVIASISNTGVVTTVAPGLDTIIYYTVAQGDTNFSYHPLTIDAHVAVSAITGPSSSFCIGALLPLTDSVPTGTWQSNDTTIATVNATGFVSGRVLGSTIISYTISNTCGTSRDTMLITVTPSSGYVIGTISGASTICAGSTTAFTDTTSGGLWRSTDTTIAIVSTSGTVTGIGYGTTTITYGFAGSCGTYITTKSISTDTLLHADSITGPGSICNGNSSTLTDAAGPSGVWTASNGHATMGSTTGLFTAISAGIDTITYSASNTCGTSTGRKIITINPQPFAAPVTGATSVCPADTIFLADTSVGGTWRLVNNKASISPTGRVIGNSAGTDTALYVITNSCGSDTASAILTILPLPNPGSISGAVSVCIGSSITLRDTTSGGTWSTTNSNASLADSVVTGVTAGADTIKYAVTNSCGTASATRKITIYAYPVVDTISGPSVVCTGSSITLIDTTTGGVWSKTNIHANIAATGVVTGISAGLDTIKYTVTTNGCASVATKSITVLQLTAGLINSASTVCVGTSVILKDTVKNGVWSNTNHFSSLADTVLTGVSAGTDTVAYTVTGTCGSVTTIKKITINPQPYAAPITGSVLLAAGDTIILRDSIAGGVWGVTNTNALVSATGLLGGLKEGQDTVVYIVTNSCGKDTAYLPITIASAVKPGTITDIRLYPNPSRGVFQFNVVSKVDEVVSIVLSNSVYQAFDLFQVPTNTVLNVQLDYLADGVYFLSAISKQGWHTVKFVIAR